MDPGAHIPVVGGGSKGGIFSWRSLASVFCLMTSFEGSVCTDQLGFGTLKCAQDTLSSRVDRPIVIPPGVEIIKKDGMVTVRGVAPEFHVFGVCLNLTWLFMWGICWARPCGGRGTIFFCKTCFPPLLQCIPSPHWIPPPFLPLNTHRLCQ